MKINLLLTQLILVLAGFFLAHRSTAQHIKFQPASGGFTTIFSPAANDTSLSITDSRTIRFKPGNGGFIVGAFGSERLFVSNAGNVGIGTTSPVSPLQIGNRLHFFPVSAGGDEFSVATYNAYWNGSSLTRPVAGASSIILQGENALNEPSFSVLQFASGSAGSTFLPGSALYRLSFENGRFGINRDNPAAGFHVESPDNQAFYLDMSTDGSRPEMRIFGDVANSAGIKASSTMPSSYTLTLPDDDGTNGQLLQTDGSGFLTWVDPVGTPDAIQDTDGNTSIQVEKTVNDDIIRFNLAGAERMILRQNGSGNARLEFSAGSIGIGVSAGQNNTAANNVFLGSFSGSSNTSGNQNVYLGHQSGKTGTTASRNAIVGFDAGKSNTTGSQNTFLGSEAGRDNTTADNNTYIGTETGRISSGQENTFLGSTAGTSNLTGSSNVFLGYASGYLHNVGNNNVFVGTLAGQSNTTGAGNVFLGHQAGANETGSNLLYIDNSNTATPLIKGDFANDKVEINGNVEVTGTILCDTYDYNNAQTHYLSVPGAAFRGMDASTTIIMNNTGPFQQYVYLSGASNRAIAPVYLPDGAVIKRITMYFEDQAGVSITGMDVMLLTNASATTLSTASYNGGSNGATSGVTAATNAVPLHIVDNQNNSYCLMWTPGSLNTSVRLYRAVVEYTKGSPD